MDYKRINIDSPYREDWTIKGKIFVAPYREEWAIKGKILIAPYREEWVIEGKILIAPYREELTRKASFEPRWCYCVVSLSSNINPS